MQFALPFSRRSAPLPPGTAAPELSLTADDGAWVRLDDYTDRTAVIVFVSDVRRPDSLRALESIRPWIEALPGKLFAVNHARPDVLRSVRAELALGFPLLYDLGAWASRGWHQTGLRPYVRDGYAIVRAGRIASHQVGSWSVDEIRQALHSNVAAERDDAGDAIDWSAAEQWIHDGVPLVDVRTPDEFAAIHHPAARSLPLDELPSRFRDVAGATRVLVVCQTGGRSDNAVGFLRASGIAEARSVRGGMNAWSGRG